MPPSVGRGIAQYRGLSPRTKEKRMRKGRCLKWSKGRTRCMRRAKSKARRRKSGSRRRRRGGTKGMHCVRFKRTSGGRRCAEYAR